MTQDEYKEEARRLRPRLVQMASRYLDAEAAEDTVQDVLLRLWQMRTELHLPIDGLAIVLTRNYSISQMRRKRPTTVLTKVAQTADNGVAEDAETDERVERMLRVMDSLPSMQQTILKLRHMEGMEMGQIAELTGTTEVAIRKALSRARQAVRNEYLKRYDD